MFSFLEYRDWENACELLKFQISRKAENRHFNTLSLHTYRNLSIEALKDESYFKHNVKCGLVLFYGNSISSKHFPAPKGTFRYRHWTFISLQMRLLYYALGLYVSRRLTLLPFLATRFYFPQSFHNLLFGKTRLLHFEILLISILRENLYP
jgi:hypothetical protein